MPIHTCTCGNAYQDKLYGKGKRVHNHTAKGMRCTVCGNNVTTTASAREPARQS